MDDDFKIVDVPKKRKNRKDLKSCNGKNTPLALDVRCPLCQFPFIELKGKHKDQHVENCNGAEENTEECPHDMNCQERNVKHFQNFSHFKLAISMSSMQTVLINEKIDDNSISTNDSDHLVNSRKRKKKKMSDSLNSLNSDSKFNNSNVCNLTGKIIYSENIVTSKSLAVNYGSMLSCEICSKEQSDQSNTLKPSVNINFSSDVEDLAFTAPVQLNIVYNDAGWKKITVDFVSGFEIQEFQLNMGKCCHFMEMKCVIGRENVHENNEHKTQKTLGFFDFASLSLNNCISPEKCVVEKIWMNYSSDIADSESNYTETEVNIGEKTCSDNDSSSFCLQDISIADNQNEILELSSVAELDKNEAKEKWKNIFKKDSTITSTNIKHSSEYVVQRGSAAKVCPFYKLIPGTSFAVDAFQYGYIKGVTHYFLSHFHADHYGGLTKKFKKPIICSNVTAALAVKKLYIERKYLYIVKHMETFTIGGVVITPLDANHCPGSFMFLFQTITGNYYLHVGDFRANSKMETYPALSNIHVDTLFLDTTYCNPRYEFPTQEDAVAEVVRLSLKQFQLEPATLFVSGTYTIGKEKIFMGIANALKSNIWAPKAKRDILKCLKDEHLNSKLVEHPCKARVHVWPMTSLNHESLEQHLRDCNNVFKHVLAFNPTGWNFSQQSLVENISAHKRGRVTIISVSYSEHSNYSELRKFVKFLKPRRVIPTVPSRNQSFSVIAKCCTKWLTETEEKDVPDRQQKLTTFFTKS